MLLDKHDKRKQFDCGVESLNNYLRFNVNQDLKKNLSVAYVLKNTDNNHVVGYYTLSSSSIDKKEFPESFIKKLKLVYPKIPVILIGRLAIDKLYQGKGWGKSLLYDSLKRCYNLSKQLGAVAVYLDPIDESVVKYYESFGFVRLPDSGKLIMPMKTIEELIDEE